LQGAGCRVQDARCGVHSARLQDAGCRVQDARCGVRLLCTNLVKPGTGIIKRSLLTIPDPGPISRRC
jgi:hypothetical protein